jgi:hypothetical protein
MTQELVKTGVSIWQFVTCDILEFFAFLPDKSLSFTTILLREPIPSWMRELLT